MIRLAFTERDAAAITAAFGATAPEEMGAFLLLRQAVHRDGVRLVVSAPYFPRPDEWDRIGADQLQPSARLLSAMVSRAVTAGAGLLFIHSHPNPHHPTAFSPTDEAALSALGATIQGLIDGPFAAAVVGPNGWVGSVFLEDAWRPIDRLTAAGRRFQVLEPLQFRSDDLDARQELALGRLNPVLRSLDLTVIGCGGLGSPLAETLLRMGVRRLTLIDNQQLDTPSNVRRMFGATVRDLEVTPPRDKVQVVAEHCRGIGIDCDVREVLGDVRNEGTLLAALDADVLLCATDSHSSRAVIDAAAFAFNLPVIDCGVRVGARHKTILSGLTSEVRIIGPDLPCLWCLGVLSAEAVRAENLPSNQREALAREGYLVGVEGAEPSVTALTVMGAGMMSCALLALLSADGANAPTRYYYDGFFGHGSEVPGTPIEPSASCICRKRQSQANRTTLGLVPTGSDG